MEKLVIITGCLCVALIILFIVDARKQYNLLQTKTGEQKIMRRYYFESNLLAAVTLSLCGILEIIYFCLHGFSMQDLKHFVLFSATVSEAVYFVSTLIFQKITNTIANSSKNLTSLEVETSTLSSLNCFQKSFLMLALSLNICTAIGYVQNTLISKLLIGNVCITLIVLVILSVCISGVKK